MRTLSLDPHPNVLKL